MDIGIVSETAKQKTKLINVIEQMKGFINEYTRMHPSKIRGVYNRTWEVVEDKSAEIEIVEREITESIKNLEECKPLLQNLKEIIQKIKEILNKSQVGTLEGRARQVVTNSEVYPEHPLVRQVVAQSYNEGKRIGGRKRRNKTNRKIKTNKKRGKTYNKKIRK